MLRVRCVRHVMPSGSSCKVKGPSPPEGGRGGVGGGAGDPQDNSSLRRLGECRHCRAFSFSGSNLILNGDWLLLQQRARLLAGEHMAGGELPRFKAHWRLRKETFFGVFSPGHCSQFLWQGGRALSWNPFVVVVFSILFLLLFWLWWRCTLFGCVALMLHFKMFLLSSSAWPSASCCIVSFRACLRGARGRQKRKTLICSRNNRTQLNQGNYRKARQQMR